MKELNMDPPLFLYKLLGGLPYTWNHHDRQEDASNTKNRIGTLWKSTAWVIWNYVFGGTILGYFAFASSGVTMMFDDCANTLAVIGGIEDFIGVCTTFALRVHMIFKHERLAVALATEQELCVKYEFQAKPYWKDRKFLYIAFYITFGFSCITYGNVSMALESGWKASHKMAIFEATVKPTVLATSMLLYARTLDLIAYVYNNFIAIVTRRNSNNVVDFRPMAWSSSVDRVRGSKTSSREREEFSDPMEGFDGFRAKTLILELYDASMKVKRYFQFLVALTLAHGILSAIVNCFVAASNKHMSLYTGVATVGGLVITLSPAFYITNAPWDLNSSKANLRMELIKYQYNQHYEHLKEELADITSLLQERPEFNILGYFNLGRARIVDILTFIATYLVILMQFRIVEDGAPTCGANLTGAVPHSSTNTSALQES